MIDIKLTPVHNYILSQFIGKTYINFTENKIIKILKRYKITRETFLKSLNFLARAGLIKKVSGNKCHKYKLQIPFDELQKELGLISLFPTYNDFNLQTTDFLKGLIK